VHAGRRGQGRAARRDGRRTGPVPRAGAPEGRDRPDRRLGHLDAGRPLPGAVAGRHETEIDRDGQCRRAVPVQGGQDDMSRVPQVVFSDPDRGSADEVQKMLTTLGYHVVGSAGYGVEAVTLAYQLRPDVVLMHVEEPLVRTIQTLSRINDGLPDM